MNRTYKLVSNSATLQKLLHEEPYTDEEIKKITGESLTSVFQNSPTSLDVLKAAKHYKLFQVDFMFSWFVFF
jgi:N-acetylgalactosamine kinase